MTELVFASANRHKLEEIAAKLGRNIRLIGLHDIGCTETIPETASTLEGNAALKARYVFEQFGKNCFADDTGLEAEALGGEPGVHSARYAGKEADAEANIAKLLSALEHHHNRRAHFRTVICHIAHGKEWLFEGMVSGHIAREKRGNSGFGYDPVFIPEGSSRSFAEMSLAEKNLLSHRAKAITAFKKFLYHTMNAGR